MPNKERSLTKNSPIMQNPKEVTKTHRSGNEYFLTEEQVEQALCDSIRLSGENIPTNRFKDNDITSYAFGDIAEDYGKWLENEAGIKEMPIYLNDVYKEPFARQIWFRCLDDRSGLGGYYMFLNLGDDRLRGVKGISLVDSQKLENILNEIEIARQKNDFGKKFKLFGSLNKKIEHLVKQERYEDAHRLSIERDNLYKELR